MSNMQVLRKNLFDTMSDLRESKIPVATANAIAATGQVLINSLKLELDAMKLAGNKQLPEFIKREKEIPQEESEIDESKLSVESKELNDLIPAPRFEARHVTVHHFASTKEDDE